jgi:hypothetical protein
MLDPKRRQGRDHVDGRPAPSAVCRLRAVCVPPPDRRTQVPTGATSAHQCTPVHTSVCLQPMREPRPGSPAASTHHRQQETWRRPPLPCVSSCSRRVAPQRVDWAASVSRHRLGVEQVLARSCRPGVNRASTRRPFTPPAPPVGLHLHTITSTPPIEQGRRGLQGSVPWSGDFVRWAVSPLRGMSLRLARLERAGPALG